MIKDSNFILKKAIKNNILSPREKIVYSTCLLSAIAQIDCIFKPDEAKEDGNIIDITMLPQDMSYIESDILTNKTSYDVACLFGIDRTSYSKILSSLSVKGFIKRYNNCRDIDILYDESLYKGGFIEVIKDNDLTAIQQIVYSYIYAKSKLYKGKIDTFNYILCEDLNMSERNIQTILKVLKSKGLIEIKHYDSNRKRNIIIK